MSISLMLLIYTIFS